MPVLSSGNYCSNHRTYAKQIFCSVMFIGGLIKLFIKTMFYFQKNSSNWVPGPSAYRSIRGSGVVYG